MLRGSALHLYLESKLSRDPKLLPRLEQFAREYPDQDELSDVLTTCEKISRDDILRGSELVSCEEAFAYHPATDTARSLGTSIERTYLQHGWKPTEEIPGTADVILRSPSGDLIVGDFKTGHYDNQVSYTWGPQLDLLALMASRTYRADSVTVAICLVMDEGRVHWTQERHLDFLALDAIAAKVSRAVAGWVSASTSEVPATKPGPWCDGCASRAICPAWASLARSFAVQELSISALLPVLTPESAGAAWEKLQQYDALSEEIQKQLRAYAHSHPLLLPDGTRLAHVTRYREELDGQKTAEYLRAAYNLAKADEVTKVKVTKAALEKVFGREEAKSICDLLRKKNAVKRHEYTVLEPVRKRGAE